MSASSGMARKSWTIIRSDHAFLRTRLSTWPCQSTIGLAALGRTLGLKWRLYRQTLRPGGYVASGGQHASQGFPFAWQRLQRPAVRMQAPERQLSQPGCFTLDCLLSYTRKANGINCI